MSADAEDFAARWARIEAESRAHFERAHPNGVEPEPMPEQPADPLAELADDVSHAIDEHTDAHEDEAHELFPGVRLNPSTPGGAELIARLQRGEGTPHAIKLHTEPDGSLWAVEDFYARLKRDEQADREYDERAAAAPPAPAAPVDGPAYIGTVLARMQPGVFWNGTHWAIRQQPVPGKGLLQRLLERSDREESAP